jgi:agmatine/peptidylarginine deiminase
MSKKKVCSVSRSPGNSKPVAEKVTEEDLRQTPSTGFIKPMLRVVRDLFAKRYGFAVFALIVFLSGAYWGSSLLSPGMSLIAEKKNAPTKPSGSPSRTSPALTQPEDYFPAAEFRKQSAILIGCQGRLHLTPKLYLDIARAIDRRVPLFGIVNSSAQAERGAELMRSNGLPADAMRFLVLPCNTMWIRDYAPCIVRYDDDSAVVVVAKYQTRDMREDRKQDELMGLELARLLGLPARSVPLLLEGGNMLSNGDGMLFTTPKTLELNQKQHYSQKQLMSMFDDYLGVRAVFAVGALQEEPNGHVDMFMSMLGKNLAVVGEITRSGDPENRAVLDKNAEYISKITTSSGPIKVVRIPMPPRSGDDWRSYTNVIMANGLLLMPSYADVDPAIEDRAEAVYRSLLPGWSVKRINCDKLVFDHGQLHCISYHIPHFVSIEGLLENAIPKVSKDG